MRCGRDLPPGPRTGSLSLCEDASPKRRRASERARYPDTTHTNRERDQASCVLHDDLRGTHPFQQGGLVGLGEPRRFVFFFPFPQRISSASEEERRVFVNDPSAGSPTETLLRLLLPLDDQVRHSFRHSGATRSRTGTNPRISLNHPIGSSDGRCVQGAGT